MAVLDLQAVAVQAHKRRPVQALGNDRGSAERRLRLLVRHLQEQQERELLDVVLIGQAVVPQDVAIVPELLNNGRRCRS